MAKNYYYKYDNGEDEKGYLCLDTKLKKLPQGYSEITQEQYEQYVAQVMARPNRGSNND